MVRDYCCDCPTGRSETNHGGNGDSRECRERLSFQEECFVRMMKLLQILEQLRKEFVDGLPLVGIQGRFYSIVNDNHA
jgi:hypothetical protein